MPDPVIADADTPPQTSKSASRPLLWQPEPPILDDNSPVAKDTAAPIKQARTHSVPRRKHRASAAPDGAASADTSQTLDTPAAKPRYSPTIKELPSDERPRERLYAYGPGALSTAELIAILIRVGTSERSAVSLGEHLLAHFGNIKGVACAGAEELSHVKGIGHAKAAQIKAAIEFGNRLSLFTEDIRPSIGGPRDVANLLMPDLRYIKKETLKSLLCDTKNRVIAIKTVSIGDLSSSIVHPREVFKDAVIASAASIIIAHNHPSGDPTPSSEDIAVTKRLIEAGEIMGIDVLDHIVIGDGRFVSLKERGLM